jgi:Flp pilus assembly protein CpaB
MAAIGQAKPATTGIRTPLFILGVAMALLAFLLMMGFGVIFASRSHPATSVRVVVASQDISQREPITADMITYGTVSSDSLPPRAFTHMADLAGYAALVEILKGQVLTSNIVSANRDLLAGATSSFLPIPTGYIALTLPTGEQQGVAGYIAQGDYINIIASVNTGLITSTNPRTVTRTVFTSVYVIRVGPESTVPRQGVAQGLATSLTILMSECDAQYMTWLILNASLKYVLLSYHDYKQAPEPVDPACPSTAVPGIIGPAQIDARWGFTR